jgi:limonene-1,2-epoxide hydrolase
MNVGTAKQYFDLMDSPEADTDDVLKLYAESAVIKSPRQGIIEGKDKIRDFYEANSEFFVDGEHAMQAFHEDGNTVVCEGLLDGETSAGREFQGIGLVDIMQFNDNGKIEEFRAYLDYSAILSQLPDNDEVPSLRES